ncbi:winged helix DNA-binding protein [Oceanibacterium hippocampi]|uniref:MarR family protein n=1 Tax=Oceanibacterium hippocampi TaxID=745714 RepID=A0A1Y5RSP6_9PROT|nr:winged helix DNA-binding protein [Oceanibacterium hippocampi]SLN24448.1 MarR family protein [Oceanibacterium hippocampi]
MSVEKAASARKQPIVSSAHLMSEESAELSEFEYGLIVASNAFMRWVQRCMEASGNKELSSLDILVLHSVNHREREKRLNDICFVLHIEDSHTITYSLKKLVKAGLVDRRRSGKEVYYISSELGRELCLRYRDIRENCLIASLSAIGLENESIGDLADRLRALSGLYDQAARAATSL